MEFLCCGLGVDFGGFLFFCLLFHLFCLLSKGRSEWSDLRRQGSGVSPGKGPCLPEEPRTGRGWGAHGERPG